MTEEQFIEECRFAKEVRTAKGTGLLIGDFVIGLDVPGYPANQQINFASALVTALRNPALLTGDEQNAEPDDSRTLEQRRADAAA